MAIKVTIDTTGISEARSAVAYFLDIPDSGFNAAAAGAFTVDIGGGTTDIAYWHQNKLEWEDSVKFAGSNLVEISYHLTDYVKKIASENSKGKFEFDSSMRIWPLVHPLWDDKMEAFLNRDEALRVLRTIALFYGAICFYIGMHLRSTKSDYPDRIAFAGNGTRFLNLITRGSALNDSTFHPWQEYFRKMIQSGAKIGTECNTRFDYSPEPKLEVAKGLVSRTIDRFLEKNRNSSKKLLGLDIVMQDGTAHKFDQWTSDTAKIIASATFDFTIFNDFLSSYKKEAHKIDPNWKVSNSQIQIDNVFIDILRARLTKRGDEELANSLFFEAVHIWMKLQYDK